MDLLSVDDIAASVSRLPPSLPASVRPRADQTNSRTPLRIVRRDRAESGEVRVEPGDVRHGGADVRHGAADVRHEVADVRTNLTVAGRWLLDQAETGGGDGTLDLGEVDDKLGAVGGEHELAEQDGLAVGIVGDALAAQHWRQGRNAEEGGVGV